MRNEVIKTAIKYFCDKCGKEISEMVTEVTYSNWLHIKTFYFCYDCAEKILSQLEGDKNGN